jgi:hypothetical protein
MADTPMPEGGDEMMGGGATGNDAWRGRCGSVPIYWDLPEAAKLFGFCNENGDNAATRRRRWKRGGGGGGSAAMAGSAATLRRRWRWQRGGGGRGGSGSAAAAAVAW